VVEGIFWVLDNGAKWKDLPARFEQSFSDDGGKTWEVNWIAIDTRVKDEAAEAPWPPPAAAGGGTRVQGLSIRERS
jgi:hypothetical protein